MNAGGKNCQPTIKAADYENMSFVGDTALLKGLISTHRQVPPTPQMKPAPQPRQPYYTTNLPISSGPGGVPPSSGSWPGTSNHVYHSGPGFQMMMNPGQQLSFPRSPQGPAFIPGQYWPTTYVATPHQYPVPAGSSGFFPGTSSTQYGTYAYYPSQSQLSSSAQAAPVIMNHTHQQQQHIRTKRERKLIRVRDPNQGGRDITEEIMSGVCTDSSPSPPQTARSGAENNAVVQASGESITASTTEADRPEDRRKPSTPPEFSNGDSIPSGTTSSHTKTKTLSPPRLSETECTPIHTFSTLGPNTPVIDLMDSPLRPRGPAVPLQSVPKVAADPLHTSSQDRTEKKATEEEVKVEEAKTIEEFAFMETSLALSSTLYSDAQVETESMSVMLPRRNLGAPLESPIAQPEEPCLPNGLPLAAPQDLELPKVSMAERESRPIAELENSQQVKHTLTAITQAAPADQSRPVVQEPVADRAAKAAARPEIKNVVPPLDAKKNSPVPQSTSKEESASEKVPTPPSPTAEEQDSQTFTPALVETTVQELNKAIKYDREFLLGLQFVPVSMVKPDCLPPIKEVVLDKVRKIPIRPQDPNRPSGINGGPDFTPTFTNLARPSLGGGSRGPPSGVEVGIRGQHGSHQMHWKEPRKIITITSLGDAVQLNKAQNAWKPSASKDICGHGGGETLEEQIKTQELLKRFRSILNKLTPQKFEKLMKQVKELNIDSEESLKGVIDLIFEKAISEPTFSVTYANMCHCLMGLKLKSTGVSFHKLLLKRCQTEFEKNKDDDESLEKKTKELEASSETEEKPKLMELQEAKDKNRRRSLGNIKFIGELFKLKMLTQVIMHDCIIKLLKSHDEESLECLCTLLSTIGKDLDFEEAKPRMNQYFHQMDKIVKERKTTSRIRFMLQDVLDLRLNNWVPRRGVQGPKTIDQIHKEAELEEHREQMKVQQALVSKNELGASPVGRMIAEGLDGRGNPHSPCTGAPPQDDGRNTLPISKNQPADISHLHKTTKTNADLNNRLLGPGGKNTCGSWVKGCSGGIGAKPADSGLEAGGHPAISAHNRSPTSQQPLSTSGSSNDSDRQFGQRNSSSQERSDYFDRSVHSCEVEYRGSGDFVFKAAKRGMTDDRGSTERASSVENAKRVTAANALPAEVYSKPSLTEEELNKESIATIEEYLHIKDVKEALLCVQDMNNTQLLFVFVRNGVELTLERSTVDRERMGLLLHHLIQSGTLPTRQYYKGLQEILELAKDMAIDIPFIWLYLAELITPMLDEGGIPMGGLFREISHHLIPLGKAGVLLAHILTLLCKGMSHEKVGTMWREAGLQWKDFLPEVEDVNQFVRERKVEFTLGEESEKSKRKVLGSSEMTKQLDKLIQNQAENQKVIDWIEANLDEQQALSNMFIRTLMTRICRSAIIYENPYRLDSEQIKRRAKLLQKYLKDEQKQLQALYALQAQLVQMDQPANLLRMFFDTLYDEDIIKEEAFYKWESSQDPAEQQGKKVALISVTSFFIWLCEAGNESS